jgi:hypothetical protein
MERGCYYSDMITHNLNSMAKEAGMYECLWHPSSEGITKASQLIVLLHGCLKLLNDHPEHFKKFNSSNGFGKYEDFVKFVESYLEACLAHPDATVVTST